MDKNLLEVSMMLGNAIDKLNNLSAYKPKEKKKLYLWAYKDKTTKSWKLTDRYMESAEDVEQDYLWIDDFQRIDSSMIEVDA
jgi:hypothetical protein